MGRLLAIMQGIYFSAWAWRSSLSKNTPLRLPPPSGDLGAVGAKICPGVDRRPAPEHHDGFISFHIARVGNVDVRIVQPIHQHECF